jgi:hypothetical protein
MKAESNCRVLGTAEKLAKVISIADGGNAEAHAAHVGEQ